MSLKANGKIFEEHEAKEKKYREGQKARRAMAKKVEVLGDFIVKNLNRGRGWKNRVYGRTDGSCSADIYRVPRQGLHSWILAIVFLSWIGASCWMIYNRVFHSQPDCRTIGASL